jgi:hypothetical protein
MKIEEQRQTRAKQLIQSLLADKGTNFKAFCESKGLNYLATYQKLFRNKQVKLSELNDFIKLIDKNRSLEITKNSIVLVSNQLK